MSFFKKVSLAILLLAIVGCTNNPYVYDSPTPGIIAATGSPDGLRDANPPRYDGYNVLASSVKKAAPVQVTVTYEYRNNGNQIRTRRCKMHITASDTSIADVYKCTIDMTGWTEMVLFDTGTGKKSFDLRALGGKYDGLFGPVNYNGRFVSINFRTRRWITMRYTALLPDRLDILK